MTTPEATGRTSRARGKSSPTGRKRRPVDPETRTRIVELAEQGMARNAIAREVGVSASTVTKYAKRAGIAFDRSKTAEATRAREIDNAATRAEIAAGMLSDLQDSRRIMRELPAPTDLRGVEQRTRAQANQARQFADITRAAPVKEHDANAEVVGALKEFAMSLGDVARLARYEALYGPLGEGDDDYGREDL
ncbi:helix-turn-helix domain-containing protein [Microbacterium sp. YY-01]|uniref:helix-turn-helix domain-containing protein n=1 Tax=Microbacterium sp. YY-01 TaxID=3421634 RepID=UPI003D171D6E